MMEDKKKNALREHSLIYVRYVHHCNKGTGKEDVRFSLHVDTETEEKTMYMYKRDILFRWSSLFDDSLQYEKAKGTHMYIDK